MTILLKKRLIDLSTPKVMGILNLTPDSFYDGGLLKFDSQILKLAEKHLKDGAFALDLGGYSSRPGADHISEEYELGRVLPVVELLTKEFPEAPLSIDTFRSTVADACLKSGASMINDISGSQIDPKILEVVAKHQVPYIGMHMKGTPQTMKNLCQYDDLMVEMRMYFSNLIKRCTELHIHDVIIDPGFGFAKNTEQNFQILRELKEFQLLDCPILIGLSRKSMIYKTLGTNTSEALNGTTALNMIALHNGASILRVHDVKEAMECVTLSQNL
ncbi:MAG: Dihydropteroate synthase [Flavobacteriaceae bacterium]|nr:MAG: Dihydropteroate synthase [Flavobacteriaceae bacterium]